MILETPNRFILALFSSWLLYGIGLAQPLLEFNALADLEFSIAGDKSHFYYNEIDQDHTSARLSIYQLNLIGKVILNKHWSFSTRLMLQKEKGRALKEFKIPQLSIQWLSKSRNIGVLLGRFINPFGAMNQKQLSIDRNFVGLPLAYAYYTNISEQLGYVKDLGDITKIPLGGIIQWGLPNLYFDGYTTGTLLSWNIMPSKVSWKLALSLGASNVQDQFSAPLQYGIISRLKLQPTYFWEQGVSFSYGTFLRENTITSILSDLHRYLQTLVGTDFKVGSGFLKYRENLSAPFIRFRRSTQQRFNMIN